MSKVILGLSGNTYYTTATRLTWAANATTANGFYTGAAPQSCQLLSVVRNVNTGQKDSEADVTSRASNGYKLTANALRELQLEFEIPWTPADAGFQALQAAYNLRTTIAVVALDGSILNSGSQGPWADWNVIEFPREEPIEKEMMSKVVLKPAASGVSPQWVQVN